MWFVALLLACEDLSPEFHVGNGTYAFDAGTVPAPEGLPPGLAVAVEGDTVTFRSDAGEIATATLGAEREVGGCPRNVSSDRLAARPLTSDVTLGSVTIAAPVLVPGCGGKPELFLTREGDTAGPCTGDPCVRFASVH